MTEYAISPPPVKMLLHTLIFASISLKRSKSFNEALLFWTISFLPQELLSHLFLTSNDKLNKFQWKNYKHWLKNLTPVNSPAASIAATKVFFLGVLLMSILMSVSASLLKFIWLLTMSGASTRACNIEKGLFAYSKDRFPVVYKK